MIWKDKDLKQALSTYFNANELRGEESHLKMTPYRKLSPDVPDSHREGAVMLLLYYKNEEWFFPLTERKDYAGVHSRQISFPGGKLEEGENHYQAAIRETWEEIGVDTENVSLISNLTSLYIPPSNFMVYPYVSTYEGNPSFLKQEEEVEEIVEVALKDLLDEANMDKSTVKVYGEMTLVTPCFKLNNKVVWGATAAILAEFKDIVKKIGEY